jgi:hypothetical protein
MVADLLAAETEAVRPGVRDDAAVDVDHRHLPLALQRIDRDQLGERFRRAPPRPHQRQAARPVADVDIGLRRHRTDTGLGEGHQAADREPVRLDGDATLAGVGVEGDDRIGHRADGNAPISRATSNQGQDSISASIEPFQAAGERCR